jgi:hypothetical protein
MGCGGDECAHDSFGEAEPKFVLVLVVVLVLK